jgi:hypothetical protein
MTTEEPRLACSLDADRLRRRLATIAGLGAEALRGATREGGVHRLSFGADPSVRRRLEEAIAAERRCCPFLELELTDRDGSLVLSIAAPAEAQPVADELAAAFRQELDSGHSRT